MNRRLSAVEIFPRTWDTSRDYWVQLAEIELEQADLESQKVDGEIVDEYDKRIAALQIYREMLNAMWGRDESKGAI